MNGDDSPGNGSFLGGAGMVVYFWDKSLPLGSTKDNLFVFFGLCYCMVALVLSFGLGVCFVV